MAIELSAVVTAEPQISVRHVPGTMGYPGQTSIPSTTSGVVAASTNPSALGPSIVAVSGTQLVVQKRMLSGVLAPPTPYTIRGINWSPASRATNTTPPDPNNANVRRQEYGLWYQRDIPLLAAMHVNTVRLFIDPGFDATLGPIGLQVLDELYRHDIMVIMTVDDAINDLDRIRGAVPFYKNHPAVLMWSLGSEWNISRYFRGWSIEKSAAQTEIAAQLVKTLDADHPVVSSYGEIDIDAPGLRLSDTSRYVNTVVRTPDVWSVNLYRGSSFDNADSVSAFDQWVSISVKPMFVGEFGVDAFHGRCLTEPPTGSVNEAEQATWTLDLWNDLAHHLSANDPANVALGGTAFEFNDEWWKVAPPGSQQTGGWQSDGFPDWHASEEYFGVVDVDRTPRQVYAALAAAFDPGYRPPPHTTVFRAISRGANLCGAQADFRRDGHTFYQRGGMGGGGRGFNVAIVDPQTGAILEPGRNFDTWAGGGNAKQGLMDYLTAVPEGRLIMLAVADEAGITSSRTPPCSPFNDPATIALVQRLQALGSTRIDDSCWRGSWAMLAIKGTGVALSEGYELSGEARAEHAFAIRISDEDGLPDVWETRFGLDPLVATGPDGPEGDPDGDGRSNLEEYRAGTHPRSFYSRYFAEGATGAFFDLRLALVNPGETSAARVLLRFLTADGTTRTHFLTVPALSRRTVDPETMAGLESAEFATVIESDGLIVADRTMTWGGGYGSHAETSIAAAGREWFLAEGATHSGFQLFYLLQNPNAAEAHVRIEYLLPAPQLPLAHTYTLAPASRTNVWVNMEPGLESTDVSATVTSDLDIVVERAMYLDRPREMFAAGHESAAVRAPATEWFLAEGATGTFFDLFVLIANPGDAEAAITATFLLPHGAPVVKEHVVAPRSRFNVWVDMEDPRLADTAVSTVIASTNGVPIIVERAMWWPGPDFASWTEAHNAPGLTSSGSKWALAEGEVGGRAGAETYILLANRGAADTAKVTLLYEGGTTETKVFSLPANSRTNVPVGYEFPNSRGQRFGAIVEALGNTPDILVERAMYSNANGVSWAAGMVARATKIR